MKLIAGLGNPGNKYQNNRHNLGFMVADSFAKGEGLSWRFSQDWMCNFAKTNDFTLIKPTIYMNKSGEAVLAVSNFYKIDAGDVLVICDDLDLPFGKIRLAFNGLSAGHHGIESVIKSLGTMEFARLRVGIGRPSPGAKSKSPDPTDYVLEDFSGEEQKEISGIIEKAQEAIKSFISDGIESTMNRFN